MPRKSRRAGTNAGLEEEREGEVLLLREVADIKVGDQAAVEGRELDNGRRRTAEERERLLAKYKSSLVRHIRSTQETRNVNRWPMRQFFCKTQDATNAKKITYDSLITWKK